MGCGDPDAGIEFEQATENARLRGVMSPSSAVSCAGAALALSTFFLRAIASDVTCD
jgi:hypothetical protein